MGVKIEEVRKFLGENPDKFPDKDRLLAQAEMIAAANSDGYLPSSHVARIFGRRAAMQIEFGNENFPFFPFATPTES